MTSGPLTGGMVAQWLRMRFTELTFRGGLNQKFSIFIFPASKTPLVAAIQTTRGSHFIYA